MRFEFRTLLLRVPHNDCSITSTGSSPVSLWPFKNFTSTTFNNNMDIEKVVFVFKYKKITTIKILN